MSEYVVTWYVDLDRFSWQSKKNIYLNIPLIFSCDIIYGRRQATKMLSNMRKILKS